MTKVYLCFCLQDKEAAEKIRKILTAYGCMVAGSADFMNEPDFETITQSIRSADCFFILLSTASVSDTRVGKELSLAVYNNVRPISLILDDVQLPPDFEYFLGIAQRIVCDDIDGKPFEYRLLRALPDLVDPRTSSGYAPAEKGGSSHSRPPQPSYPSVPSYSQPLPCPPPQASPARKRGGLFSMFSRKSRQKEIAPPVVAPRTSYAATPPVPEADKAQFSALAPERFTPGEYAMIDILMYEPAFEGVVKRLKKEAASPVKETRSGVVRVSKASSVKVVLSSSDVKIDDGVQTQEWQGDYLRFSYAVLPPESCGPQILFNADVYINDVIATKLKFIVKLRSEERQRPDISRRDITSAFVSYASQDRRRVAAIIQGMKKARPELDIFFDIESLHSGDNWENALRREIDKRDVLFLCWSVNAERSEWVDYEWRYALAHKGIENIEPIPLEPPEVCPPPNELKEKHFNDKLLYVINSNY